MLPDGSISASNIWKRFRADRQAGGLGEHLGRLGRRLRKQGPGWNWALCDVSFEAQPGESVGLIGSNGSGKSTLLKILTRVMNPYAGRLEVAGRVGALIEVRGGIHPELSGRENIYLYGSLLGLSRREVAGRFDEIVDFAQLDLAIDRQVKFFSSGMQMRLGFAVAAFLRSDILLVDEVLAVGDASFQQRCLDRMRHVLSDGTTVVFVSHDLAVVEATCSRALWLDRGVTQAEGPVREVLGAYRGAIEETAELVDDVDGIIRLVKAEVTTPDGGSPRSGEQLDIRLVLESPDTMQGKLCVGVSQGTPSPIFTLRRPTILAAGQTEARCTITHLPIPRGRFFLWVGVFSNNRDLLAWHPAVHFDVMGPDLSRAPRGIVALAPVYVDASWETAHV
ncbi:MAG TPA: ABC transporter ATP-binding protein [Acidimicrobiales bacterium]|nr:ABC transporter ATP-binding protein [Acidimicrobiales bacterium]